MCLRSPYRLIILLWSILTIININKAYHIDDTFHLEAANCIQKNPLKPMSGSINWDDSPTPIYKYNQPPLFFYIIFFTQSVLGENEIIMHMLISIFTLLSLIYFTKISFFLGVKHIKLLLTIFALCPAFVINQNVMTDVPILAISLGTMYYLLKGLKDGGLKNYVLSALLLSCGLLIKYSLLPLFFVTLLSIILSKNYKKAFVLVIPLFVLLLWSIWNVIEFDSVHIFDRPSSGFRIKKIVAFLGTLGSISFFSVVYIYSFFEKRTTVFFILSGFFVFSLSVPLVYFGILNELKFNKILNYFFICNGLILMSLILIRIIEPLSKKKKEYFKTTDFPIALYILGFSVFIGIFAPFNATRHILLLIPFLILFGHKQFEKSRGILNNLVLTSTIILGVLFGISDWIYADFYRKIARKIEVKDTVWSIGHWGWQWYSKKNGMKIYSSENELNVRNGDIVVYPKEVPRQKLSADIGVDTINFITDSPNFLTFISGKNFASMYNSFWDKPAWSLSNITIDTVFICKVNKEIGVGDMVSRIKSDDNWFDMVKRKANDKGLPVDSMLILEATYVINEKRKE
ncbi:MAG: glycosyltransferase family 39 protein [Chitinophagaceae bacterium]|nr:glycosyltransferase family 39 protein [Chitinophagaceae bacterium]